MRFSFYESPLPFRLLYVNKTLLMTIIAVEYIEKDAHSMRTRPIRAGQISSGPQHRPQVRPYIKPARASKKGLEVSGLGLKPYLRPYLRLKGGGLSPGRSDVPISAADGWSRRLKDEDKARLISLFC